MLGIHIATFANSFTKACIFTSAEPFNTYIRSRHNANDQSQARYQYIAPANQRPGKYRTMLRFIHIPID